MDTSKVLRLPRKLQNASSENVAKVLRLPHKTIFDTLQNTSECHACHAKRSNARHGHIAIARTVANGCGRLGNVERTHPQPPDPQSETGFLATHSGKKGKARERKGTEGTGRERKGKEGKGRERKGKKGKGRERKGKKGKGRERTGKEGKGRERKGKDGKERERKRKEGKGRERTGKERRGWFGNQPPSHDRAQMSLLGYCTLSPDVSVQS